MRPLKCFISYSSADRKIAESLDYLLQDNGIKVWRDQTRLKVGQSWSRKVAQGLADCNLFCLLWSLPSAESIWVKHEWLTAYGLEKFIIILVLPGAPDLPAPLFNLQAMRLEGESGMDQIVAELKRHLENAPALDVARDYTQLAHNSYIPFSPNPHFKGRHLDLLDLYLKMIGSLNKVGVNQLGTVGMGGVGKTQLAVEFAYRFSFGFDGVYWIQAAKSESWLNSFVELARDRLALKIPDPTDADANRRFLIALQTYCQQHPQMLLIMDNVADPTLLNSERPFFGVGFTPLTLGCNVLFTTRQRFRLPGVTVQPVDVLSQEAAYGLLTCDRAPVDVNEEANARAICSAVGYLPLALVLAGGFLRKYSDVSFAEYREDLLKSKLTVIDTNELSAEELATRHAAAVGTTFKTQWAVITDRQARQLFRLATLFAESAIIPKARLGVLAGIGEGQSRIDRPLDRALNVLHDLSLMENLEEQSSVRLHPLVREFGASTIPESDKPAFRTWAAQNVLASYSKPLQLGQAYSNRGIDEIIEDTNVAIAFTGHETSVNSQLKTLNRLLDRERHNLKEGSASTAPRPSFFQQLQHRAICMGLADLSQAYLDTGDSLGSLHLTTIARSELEESARMRSLAGHSEEITALCWSRDGKRALSGCGSGLLTLWDVETGRALRTLEGHSNRINAVAISADGRYGVSVSDDKPATLKLILEHKIPSPSGETTLILWDIENGRPLHTSEGRYCSIDAACISGDGRQALTSAHEWPQRDSLLLWNVQSGELEATLDGHTKTVNAICFSQDGRKALSGSEKELIFWDLATHRALSVSRVGASNSVALSADCKKAMSSHSYSPTLVDLSTGERIPHYLCTNHSLRMGKGINVACMSDDARIVVTGGGDWDGFVWDVETDSVLHLFQEHQAPITAMCLSADNRSVLSGSEKGELILWEVQGGTAKGNLRTHSNRINALSITPDGSRILICQDWATRVWEPETRRDDQWGVGCFLDGSISADGERMMTKRDDTLVLWNPASHFRGDYLTGHHANSMSMSSDGLRGVTCNAADLTIWDLAEPRPIHVWQNDWQGVKSLSVNAEARGLAAAARANTVILIDLERGEIAKVLDGHGDQIDTVRMSPCGRFVVSGSQDGTVILWNVETGHVIHRLLGHEAGVSCVSLSPEVGYIVSGSADSSIILWDMNHGKGITRLLTKRLVTCVDMGSRRIVFGDDAGGVHYLEISEASKVS